MTSAEELRAELTKRGIEWQCDDEDERTTYWYGTSNGREWCRWTAVDCDGYLRIACNVYLIPLTFEEVIAATLGCGTLTAKQVLDATYEHSIHADCADADWQAIADELNATLCGRRVDV